MFKTKVYGIFERRNMVTKGKVMKKLAAIFSLSLVSVCSFGAWPNDYFQFTDARVRPLVEAINLYGDQSGVTNLGPTVNGFDASGDVSVTGDIEASGNVRAANLAVTGGSTVTTLRATGRIAETYASSIGVTNGQILLMTSRSADYSAAAQGSITVTNVLAGPGAGGVGVFVTGKYP